MVFRSQYAYYTVSMHMHAWQCGLRVCKCRTRTRSRLSDICPYMNFHLCQILMADHMTMTMPQLEQHSAAAAACWHSYSEGDCPTVHYFVSQLLTQQMFVVQMDSAVSVRPGSHADTADSCMPGWSAGSVTDTCCRSAHQDCRACCSVTGSSDILLPAASLCTAALSGDGCVASSTEGGR